MAIDIFGIQPHTVSRDLRGYSILFYGDVKSGKTTNATKFPKPLLLAFEKGYNALGGVMAQPINKWTEFLKVVKQLKDPKAKEMFETIIIDTADIAYDYCEKYIFQREGAEGYKDIPFGGGYGMVEREFDEVLRSLVQMDYGLVIISHSEDKTFTDEQNNEYQKIVPTLNKRARKVCSRMCDIIGYSRIMTTQTDEGSTEKTMLFMRGTSRFEAGSRFKYTPNYIEFSYKNLVESIHDAIDKQSAEDKMEATDERQNAYKQTTLDFDELIKEFQALTTELMGKGDYRQKITDIIESHLGRGKKVAECRKDQVDIIDIINDDLRDALKATE